MEGKQNRLLYIDPIPGQWGGVTRPALGPSIPASSPALQWHRQTKPTVNLNRIHALFFLTPHHRDSPDRAAESQ
jgi:hypothetical protein